MAAIQQILLALSQGPGSIFLDPNAIFAGGAAVSDGGSTAGVVATLNVTNSGQLTVIEESNGTLTGEQSTVRRSYSWLTSGTASLYSIRIVTSSDFNRFNGFTSDLVNSWLPMTQNRSWTLAAVAGPLPGGPQISNAFIDFTIQIALTGDEGNILATSGNFNFTCVAETSGSSGSSGPNGPSNLQPF